MIFNFTKAFCLPVTILSVFFCNLRNGYEEKFFQKNPHGNGRISSVVFIATNGDNRSDFSAF